MIQDDCYKITPMHAFLLAVILIAIYLVYHANRVKEDFHINSYIRVMTTRNFDNKYHSENGLLKNTGVFEKYNYAPLLPYKLGYPYYGYYSPKTYKKWQYFYDKNQRGEWLN